MKLKGGCDIDDVLALTGPSLFRGLQERGFLLKRKYEEVRTPNMVDSFRDEITWRDLTDVFRSPCFWESIQPCPFLVAGMRECVARGVELHLVTARSSDLFRNNMEDTTIKWLRDHDISYSKLSFVPAARKAAYCVEKDLDFMIEDRLDTALAVAHTWVTQSYLVFCPHNEGPSGRQWQFPGVRPMSRPYYEKFFERHYRY